MAKEAVTTRELSRPVVRLIITLIVLSIISWVLTSLPMLIGLWIPGMPMSISSIIEAVFGVIMIVVLLNFNRDMVPKVQGRFPTFPEMGTVLKNAVFIVVIVIAYNSFGGVTAPFLMSFSWIYPLAFLGLAIIPIYILGITLYRNVDIITDLITGKVAEATGELVKCLKCGTLNPKTTKFCSNCGTPVEVAKEIKSTVIKCKKCGADNKYTDKFCSGCGSALG